MRLVYLNLVLIVVCCLIVPVKGKASATDSLYEQLSRTDNDSVKISLYMALAANYKQQHHDSVLICFRKVIELASQDEKRFYSYLQRANQEIGVHYDLRSLEDSALQYFKKAYTVAERHDYLRGMASALNSLGIVYYRWGNYEKAVQHYLDAAKIAYEMNDTAMIVKFNDNIGHVYYYQKQFDKAGTHYEVAYKMARETGSKSLRSGAFQNLGLVDMEKKRYNEAIRKFSEALEIENEQQNAYGIANCHQNLAICYKHLEQYDKAIHHYKASQKIYAQFGYQEGVAQSWINLGELEVKRQRYDTALYYLDKGYRLCQDIKSLEGQKFALLAKSEALEKLGKPTEALAAFKKYTTLKDSILNENNLKQINELETRFERQKDQHEIEILKKKEQLDELKLSKQQQFLYGLSIAILLLLVLVVVIVIAFIQKRKTNKILAEKNQVISEKNEELLQQTEEISAQRDEIERQRSILEIRNKEITESITYARRLQNSILPGESRLTELLNEAMLVYLPKDILSGDFYWVEKIPRGILVAVVDCTGHGVPGAMMSLMGNTGLNKAVKEQHLWQPADILNFLDAFIKERVQGQDTEVRDGMDMTLCLVSDDLRSLQFAGANNPLYLVKNKQVDIVKGDNQPIGDARNPFRQHQISLDRDTSVFMFSDGFADQFGGAKGKKYTYKRFRELLVKITGYELTQWKASVSDEFQNWKGEEEQIDDVCVLGFKPQHRQ